MSRNKELVKNTFIIMFGKICTQLITFILLPIYTNYLSTEEYGTVDLIITYISLLAPLLSLQLEYAAFRFLIDVRKNENQQRKIITNVFVSLFIIALISTIIFYVIYLFYNFENSIYLFLIFIVTLIVNMLLQIARGIGDNLGYTIGSFISGGVNALISIILVVPLHFGIQGILIAMIVSNILSTIYLIIRLRIYRYIKLKSFDCKLLNELLKYSIPMIPNSICWWVISVSDRTLISYFINVAANGIYSVSSKFSGLIVTIYNMFNLSWTESVAVHINDDDADIYLSEVFNTTIKFFACCCIGMIALLPFVLNLLIGNSYQESYQYIPFLILGSFFNIIMGMLSAIYIGKKESKAMAKTSIFAALLNILINVLFISKIRIWAAVISTIIAFMFVSIYRLIDVQKFVKLKVDFFQLIILLIMYVIVTLSYLSCNMIIDIIILMLVIVISIYMNKNILINLIDSFKNKLLKKKGN